MSILIVKPGLSDTFQDAGRYGYQHLGINPSGAMDRLALQVANALTGNSPTQPVLEMHFPAAEILFQADALIALAGANFKAVINGMHLPINQPIVVAKDSIMQFQQPAHGARVYLCVRGGFHLNPWLGSCSTNTVCHMGGYHGRALEKGDTISFNQYFDYTAYTAHKAFKVLPFAARMQPAQTHDGLNILPGAQFDFLTSESREHFLHGRFIISHQSNRMGYRLQSQPLVLRKQVQLISSAVTMGTVQLLPDGQLIILMADHQTTGGYPVIGHLLSSHLPAVAQCRAGDQIQFKLCAQQQAAEQLLQQHRYLLQLQNACTFRLRQFV